MKKLGPTWHDKVRWTGTGWPGLGYNVNADQFWLTVVIVSVGDKASILQPATECTVVDTFHFRCL